MRPSVPPLPRPCPRRRATRHLRCALPLVALAAAFASPVAAAAPAEGAGPGWNFSGDLRAGYFASEQTARNGNESDQDAFNARLRVAVAHAFNERWDVRARVAGRFSSEQDGSDVYLRGYAPGRTGTAFGDITLDEAHIAYQAGEDGLRLRLGRFQTGFNLAGVASKSLVRNDSPNTDVNWTDGVHLDVPVAGAWRGHAIAQYRHRRGSGGVAYAPLDFNDRSSRSTVFLALENTQTLGPITQRMVSLTWMPDSLADRGLANRSREDYLAVHARVSAAWPLRNDGLKLGAGIEAGYAVHTPAAGVTGTGEAGEAGGLAWQAQASLYDIAPGHHIGVVYGRTDAGWLLSPDFRPNDELKEIAYQWRFSPRTSMEARVRERRELEHPGGTRARTDRDLYVRMTHLF